MFASKTPRDLNHDAHPWAHTACGYEWCDDFGGRFSFNNGTGNEFSPRREFDHVQHNEPNPILVRFRKWIEGEELADPHWVDQWIVALDQLDAFGGFVEWDEPSSPFHVLTTASPEQIAHARRVFNLLVVS
ncbi:MAG: hypothetical protein J0I43_01775 [Microbacterium sp.]|uniref:hypothetical protein n=1 Tax=Microbacterium sp. TaxID=51671 RepID=UPI001ACD71DA|nr:hypothetical protein [Microbacterium sp.]MBN9176087.1 hypothetical protein [Microbacterium sp.]